MHEEREHDRRRRSSRRAERNPAPSVEPLEGRTLLSIASLYSMPGSVGGPMMPSNPGPRPTGTVAKAPHFYQSYTGPKLAELNAVRASAVLTADGSSFVFSGTNAGRINRAPATYVWGIDRNGNLPPGPFTGRPNIKFDAVVVVQLGPSMNVTTTVKDLNTGTSTTLPSGSAVIQNKTVSVVVPSSLLPSTGLAPSQYRFNYWPEDGGPPVSSSVASFAPETTTAQVGTSR
jgi:hypothetical protein